MLFQLNLLQDVVVPGADFTYVWSVSKVDLRSLMEALCSAFGEHRIDWLPSQTKYYYNGAQTSVRLRTLKIGQYLSSIQSITKNVPTTPSEVILNVWSNGDP